MFFVFVFFPVALTFLSLRASLPHGAIHLPQEEPEEPQKEQRIQLSVYFWFPFNTELKSRGLLAHFPLQAGFP